MPNTRSSQVATPDTDFQGNVASGVPGLPGVSDQLGAAQQSTFQRLSDTAGGVADQAAQSEGKQAGAIAGLDPNWRPTVDPTIRGNAYNQAAQDTYVNNLQTQTRQSIADAYESYQNLPVDQQDPVAFKKQLDGMQAQFEQQHVFPTILPSFRQQWANQAFTYTQKAQDDNDKQVLDTAKAAYIGNQQSASDSAMRAASLASPQGDALAQQEADAHDKLVDAQVNQGTITAVAGEQTKLAFRQALSQTAVMAKFNATPPQQQPVFLANFAKSYGTGSGSLVNDKFEDDDAPLTLRNNNFTNIRDGNFAKGQPGYVGQDSGFAKFATPEAGLQAANKNLDSYANQGLNTVSAIIAKWSPPSENDTPALIRNAAQRMGVDPNAKLDMSNPDTRASLLHAILQQEGPVPYDTGQIKGAITGNPTSGLSDATYDTLSGQMTSAIRTNQAAAEQVSHKGVAELNGVQSQIEGGTDVTPDAWFGLQSKYASSTDPAIAAKLSEVSQIRSQLAGFKGQSPQQIEASIANTQAGFAASGATPQQAAVMASAQSYLKTYRQQMADDPLGRAAQEGVISGVQPVDFSNPAAAAAALQARVPQAQQAGKFLGVAPPMLLPAEKAQLKVLATAGGQPMVDAARATVQALGPGANQVFAQAGADAQGFSTVGRLAAIGGSPSFIDDFAQAQKIMADPAGRKSLELPSDTNADPQANTLIGAGLAAVPDTSAQIRQSARQVYALRSLQTGLSPKVDNSASQAAYAQAVQEAAGATFDGSTRYGGIADYKAPAWWRGSQTGVLLPPTMKSDGLPRAIGAITDGDLAALSRPPVAGDGKTPLPASALKGGYLTTVGQGVYWLSRNDPQSDDPQWAMATGGQRFRLDMNALEPALRPRVPDVYRGQP